MSERRGFDKSPVPDPLKAKKFELLHKLHGKIAPIESIPNIESIILSDVESIPTAVPYQVDTFAIDDFNEQVLTREPYLTQPLIGTFTIKPAASGKHAELTNFTIDPTVDASFLQTTLESDEFPGTALMLTRPINNTEEVTLIDLYIALSYNEIGWVDQVKGVVIPNITIFGLMTFKENDSASMQIYIHNLNDNLSTENNYGLKKLGEPLAINLSEKRTEPARDNRFAGSTSDNAKTSTPSNEVFDPNQTQPAKAVSRPSTTNLDEITGRGMEGDDDSSKTREFEVYSNQEEIADTETVAEKTLELVEIEKEIARINSHIRRKDGEYKKWFKPETIEEYEKQLKDLENKKAELELKITSSSEKNDKDNRVNQTEATNEADEDINLLLELTRTLQAIETAEKNLFTEEGYIDSSLSSSEVENLINELNKLQKTKDQLIAELEIDIADSSEKNSDLNGEYAADVGPENIVTMPDLPTTEQDFDPTATQKHFVVDGPILEINEGQEEQYKDQNFETAWEPIKNPILFDPIDPKPKVVRQQTHRKNKDRFKKIIYFPIEYAEHSIQLISKEVEQRFKPYEKVGKVFSKIGYRIEQIFK